MVLCVDSLSIIPLKVNWIYVLTIQQVHIDVHLPSRIIINTKVVQLYLDVNLVEANDQERIKDTPATLHYPRTCIPDQVDSSSLPKQVQPSSRDG
jgi:hypothetical protein